MRSSQFTVKRSVVKIGDWYALRIRHLSYHNNCWRHGEDMYLNLEDGIHVHPKKFPEFADCLTTNPNHIYFTLAMQEQEVTPCKI